MQLFIRFGLPSVILSDNGKEFDNQLYGGREMHSVFALSDFRKRIPKIDSLSKRIPKMDWWPRDAFRIRIIRFSKTDSLSKRILKMDSL